MKRRMESRNHSAKPARNRGRSFLQLVATTLSTLGVLGTSSPAVGTPRTDRTTLEARVQAVRNTLKQTTDRPLGTDPQPLAQWGNWGNWGNWYNGWNNWGNWYNG